MDWLLHSHLIYHRSFGAGVYRSTFAGQQKTPLVSLLQNSNTYTRRTMRILPYLGSAVLRLNYIEAEQLRR